MNIIYVQSFPANYNKTYEEPFTELVDRDKWMPALTIQKGYPSELWAADENPLQSDWQYDTLPSLPVRLFKVDQKVGNPQHHTSISLNQAALQAWKNRNKLQAQPDMVVKQDQEQSDSVDHQKSTGQSAEAGKSTADQSAGIPSAGQADSVEPAAASGKPEVDVKIAVGDAGKDIGTTSADLFVLNEIHGGIGVHLANDILVPNRIPFAIILRGEYQHAIIKDASIVFYETEWQYRKLTRRSWRFWQTPVDEHKLIRLPKSVDTRHFKPDPDIRKEVDIIATAVVQEGHKEMKTIVELSRHHKVGVISSEPVPDTIREKYPEITWYESVSYADIPSCLNRGRLYFHSSEREHFPMKVVEAASCGIPPLAFSDVICEDVIPVGVGLRVTRRRYLQEVEELLKHQERLTQLSQSARRHAKAHWHHRSTQGAITEMVRRVREKPAR